MTESTSVDETEVARFSAMASEWWDPSGKFRPLHKFNPVRLHYIREKACRHFGLSTSVSRPFEGLQLLDIGCGGGLLSEPMARLGAHVTGADASNTNIEIAKIHAGQSDIKIDYRATTAEALSKNGETFDIVLNMEVVEHVADVDFFMQTCANMVRPGGFMITATLNRTLKSFALGIVGAEYILRWLPVGTHKWDRFVKPGELELALKDTGLETTEQTGVTFNPIANIWSQSKDMDVNYMIFSERKKARPV
ncbi:MAG: bifunctional 2-polyprenyl-6-hydroxyphenol methylase/3-demethylubiquinol 3-O-methyltransferase UbiG [Cohaesibacteraceae bacterium]|nr:bifunctional 2-polyprenyl-6-hydroxyphenol methylase/3-demethylubiquinol 3-O-methyltransferase UbiG [Cohaesibacteraceae bacterium]MBL4875282.1 bifunctional 2-polyprenyl-6-hydroxyphenol methylase/3-demethylubiquinol 3-O-methyltransferase UbiG [Cohaesibacteraceae bacterium]